MKNLKRKLLAVAIGCFVSVGAFAQKKGDVKRPPRPSDTKVVVEPKGKPPQNNNQGGKRNDGKRGRP